MAELNQQVSERVRQELANNPDLGSRPLFDIAQEMDPSLSSLSVQQFHGRYVLPVRRDQAAQREQSGEAKPRKQARKARRSGGAAKRAATETAGEAETSQGAGVASEAAGAKDRTATKSARRSPAKAAGASEGAAAAEPTIGRERVRAVFLQFARDFAEAESRTEIVQVLSKLDEYVDQVVQRDR